MTELPKIAEPLEVSSIGSAPVDHQVRTTEESRRQLATAWGVLEVPQLTADLTIERKKDGVVLVNGTVNGEIVQECVVSFQPVRQRIDEVVESRFTERPSEGHADQRPGAEIHVDVAAETPDPLRDGRLDIGTVILEHAALAIEPYPRAEGAEIPEKYARKNGDFAESPFAKLSQLVDPKEPNSR